MFDTFDVLGEPEKADNLILEIPMLDFCFVNLLVIFLIYKYLSHVTL